MLAYHVFKPVVRIILSLLAVKTISLAMCGQKGERYELEQTIEGVIHLAFGRGEAD